jgi:hypothetical protein
MIQAITRPSVPMSGAGTSLPGPMINCNSEA